MTPSLLETVCKERADHCPSSTAGMSVGRGRTLETSSRLLPFSASPPLGLRGFCLRQGQAGGASWRHSHRLHSLPSKSELTPCHKAKWRKVIFPFDFSQSSLLPFQAWLFLLGMGHQRCLKQHPPPHVLLLAGAFPFTATSPSLGDRIWGSDGWKNLLRQMAAEHWVHAAAAAPAGRA